MGFAEAQLADAHAIYKSDHAKRKSDNSDKE